MPDDPETSTDAQAPPAPVRWITRALNEVGLISFANTAWDVKILCLQRFIRLFAYGSSTLVLAAYLNELGITETRIGLFMTLTLVGDVGISFVLSWIADAAGRRMILGIGSALMACSGLVFAWSQNYWILLLAAVFGVITPSGNEIGPFRAVEESTIAHLTTSTHRPAVFAWYTLIGTFGAALGLATCGAATTALVKSGMHQAKAYSYVFLAYAMIGVAKLLLTLLLSTECEIVKKAPVAPSQHPAGHDETAPLLGESQETETMKPKNKRKTFSLLPHISKESQSTLVQLCLLFALDNFASGLAPMSWVTYYFRWRFHLSDVKLGSLFFVTAIISAISVLVAASLARRIGNVRTMVFTHLPSSIMLAMIGLPAQLPLAMTLLIVRACTQSMDSAPRSAFLAAIVLPNERTAVMGTINVVKTIAQSVGPSVTGLLVERKLFWVAFLLAGSLKACYDVGLLLVFVGHKTREDREEEERAQSQR